MLADAEDIVDTRRDQGPVCSESLDGRCRKSEMLPAFGPGG
jgi:hypothetical protein